jgi:hypothetical protein
VLLVLAVLFVWWGWFVVGFLGEPSAVGRLRTALIVTGFGSIGVGVAGAVAGVWMLVARRT